jgi:two-component system, OmpR family, heavy metal sensor histidine kinase CusS
MLLKMRSLSVKLTIIYIVSILLITGGVIFYLEDYNHQMDIRNAMRDTEVGTGFINGAVPNAADLQFTSNKPEFGLSGADINNRLARFTRLIDRPLNGSMGWQSRIDGPVNIDYQDFYTITYFNITNQTTGIKYPDFSVTIQQHIFPLTIATFHDSSGRTNDLYYMPVLGHNNVIILVSMNDYTFPVFPLKQRLEYDIQKALPIALLFSIVFGFLISLLTVSPLKRITQAAEGLSHSDLSQRVKYKSNDEIGRLAVSFNTMADRLEESFTLQKRFVSDAAHELRTPLASMKTSVTKAQIDERNTGDSQKLLDFLSGRISHMEALVNDLLFLSRADEGKLKSDAITLDLSKLLTEAEESFRCLFEDKNINFTSEITSDLDVKADRTLILRVISNLLDNAAKNTPSGGSVSLAAVKQNNEVTITVSDTGAGIPPEHLPHIFERFYKVPGSTQSNNGYGLGLAISKSIINSTGGEISVQSELGKGSTFAIKLPQSNLQSH